MKIGIITLSRIQAVQRQYYNMQDMGLAKAFVRAGHQVILYRLTNDSDNREYSKGFCAIFRNTRGIEKQAITSFSFIDRSIEQLICFSDNQISFLLLYRWCKKNKVLLQPYVGVLRSNSNNLLVAGITNLLVKGNIYLYRKIKTYGKTPAILEEFEQKGIENYDLVPVCLDNEVLQTEYLKSSVQELKSDFGYNRENKILLFIGRMEVEKEPLEMVEIFENLVGQNLDYRLIMIGNGTLFEDVQESIKKKGLHEKVRLLKKVVYSEMWKFYCISDCMVNLNRHEIYGMAILEAMYYKCPVIAMRASGPEYIIEDGSSGFLCNNHEELQSRIVKVLKSQYQFNDTKNIIEENFYWDKVIYKFL